MGLKDVFLHQSRQAAAAIVWRGSGRRPTQKECTQGIASYQHLGPSLVSSAPSSSHVSHPPLLHLFYVACTQATPPCPSLLDQSPLRMGPSFRKNPRPQQATQHKATKLRCLLCPCLWNGSSYHLISITPQSSPSLQAEHVGHASPSAPQLPASEFGCFFLMLSKSRQFWSLTWERKFIPTHPASMAAGISLK